MTKVLVVDDEPLAAENLASKIKQVSLALTVQTEISPLAALDVLRQDPPDILFLDIRMPALSGFELLSQLEETERQFVLVFCTAYSEYALSAFKAAALDYIVKPAELSEVARAIDRATRALRGEWIDKLERTNLTPTLTRLTLDTSGGLMLLDIDRVAYITSESHQTVVYSTQHEELFCSLSLSTLEKRLPPTRFCRCHRGFIVNLEQISRIDNDYIMLCGEDFTPIPISRRSKRDLEKRLAELYD